MSRGCWIGKERVWKGSSRERSELNELKEVEREKDEVLLAWVWVWVSRSRLRIWREGEKEEVDAWRRKGQLSTLNR